MTVNFDGFWRLGGRKGILGKIRLLKCAFEEFG